MSEKYGVTLAAAIEKLEAKKDPRWVELFQHGTLGVELYGPRGKDPQKPHTRDEVYVIARGSGEFVVGEERKRFSQGDFLFVPARVPHRFEQFSDDFYAWVLFYGPEGGEKKV